MSKKILMFISSLSLILTLASCATNNGNYKKYPDALLKMPDGIPVSNNSTVSESDFDKARTKLEMSIIRQTPTPIWVPPTMAKVLIMPYVDQSGVLHSYQYVYAQLTQGHWLMGEYLLDTDQVITQHPLSANASNQNQTKIMQPLSATQAGIPQTPGVTANNNANTSNESNESNADKSFFNGGAPKKTIDTNIPEGSTDNNQQYFNNTLNAMKSGS